MNNFIPFNRPQFSGSEREYIDAALSSGHLSGDGQFTKRCSELLENTLAIPKALLTTSCTHALEMAAILLEIQPGDEVIMPSFTFVSTANAFVLRGAKPVFVDIRPDTFNIDEQLIEAAITRKTKAIVPVHYAGVACEMDAIMAIAERHKIAVVEDNAHGLFAKYKGKYLGTFGSMGTQSFHETKNFQCGEGGALLLNHEELVERAEIIREKGTNRKQFFRGEIDKYSWVDIGSSFLPSEILAAVLYAQLEKKQHLEEARKTLWLRYFYALQDWAKETQVKLADIPAHCEQSHHIFSLLMPDESDRDQLIKRLKANNIIAVHHYVPLHSSKMAKALTGGEISLPVTDDVSRRLLRLPLYNSLSVEDQDRIIKLVKEFQPMSAQSSPPLTAMPR